MWEEAPDLIKEWTRILKVGGQLRINLPNLAYAPDQAPDAVVGAEVEVPEDLAQAVRDAMDAVLEAVREQLARAVDTNAAVALDAARRNGEVK
jgi:predicted SAM-dependent methyltransferase